MRLACSRFFPSSSTVLALLLAGCVHSHTPAPLTVKPQATAPPVAPTLPPQASADAQNQPSPAEQARIRQVIAEVETAYNTGDADYRKGMLAEAKVQFDHAVDVMLSCGIDIKSHPELDSEFEKTVDQVNSLEMEALKQGNGFVSKQEITPAEAASDVTFAVDPNLVAKATAELATTKSDLPLVMNEYVASFINFFAYTQKGHNTLTHSFERSGLYKGMIQRILAEEGVPQDLIYLAVAESAFQPKAIDRKSRAGGMWQFMPGPYYGLTRNSYIDERFDPEKSTLAYARYMKFLYDQLGDWYLAMAAYDHGAGNIQRAVQRTGYADFWELYKRHELPLETQNYVPEILAAIIIANHPQQYGFDDITLDPPLLTDTVTINYSVDLRLVSDMVGAPVDEIEALNPSLLRMDTPPEDPFDLHLPAGTATLYEQRVALIPEAKRSAWRYHTVATGDTLASVAEEYHVPLTELADANQVDRDGSITGMQALVVPVPPALEPLARTRLYTVRHGDTLVTIADRFGVSLSELRRWNSIPSGIRVVPGRRLHVAEPVVVHSAPPRRKARASEEASSARPGTSTESRSRTSEHIRPSSSRAHEGSSRTGSAGSASKSPHQPAAKSSSTAKKRATQKPSSSAN
jgi:membrane-bound lytic murein transglycosylase D